MTFAHGYALLIAVDESASARWALPDVAKDVNALAGVLTDPNRCGYPSSNVTVLRGAAATRTGILNALEALRQRIDADKSGNATAFLYYSGHGCRDASVPPGYYLVPYDVIGHDVPSSSLKAREFAAAVAALRPKRLFAALDCCHAAGMEAKNIVPNAAIEPTAFPIDLLDQLTLDTQADESSSGAKGLASLAAGAGRAVLTSSQGSQLSWIRKDRTMSAFTYHLVEALTGHAQPAAGASEVLVSDVMSHVWRRVPQSVMQELGKQQDPNYEVSGNFPIALLLGGKGLPAGAAPPEPIADMRAREPGVVIRTGDITNSIGVAVGQNLSVNVNTDPKK